MDNEVILYLREEGLEVLDDKSRDLRFLKKIINEKIIETYLFNYDIQYELNGYLKEDFYKKKLLIIDDELYYTFWKHGFNDKVKSELINKFRIKKLNQLYNKIKN